MSDAGVNFINDLLTENGTFVKYDSLPDKIKQAISFFDYMSIVDAIPMTWRQLLRKNKIPPATPQKEAVYVTLNKISKPISLVTSKEVYWHLQDLVKSEPNCKPSWAEKYNISFTEKEWQTIFKLPFITTVDSKLREMQYKIIHRTYASDSYVSNFDKSVNKTCAQCNEKIP